MLVKAEMWIFAGHEYPRTFTILPTAHCLRKGSQGDGSMMGDHHLLGHLRWGKGRDEVSQAVAGWGEVGSTQEATDGSTGVCSASPEQQKPPPRASPTGGSSPRGSSKPFPCGPEPPRAGPSAGSAPKACPSSQDPVSHMGPMSRPDWGSGP